ncbi:tryptophan halogenase family protein [Sphingomonas sp. NIBR02145]|uniref:tryptophan halogenase family protein n=1 Tax=Sphingomonas sp. NIBR02145 TaxID=3014784 RepID=UPI0022B33292|nr:tryptophan halogenase family protein [Sphingomonas sp. NIBR02145]WHU04811.1 tryptophan 7-halogenase [Sphingomonas sp. NIBR02145]
MLIGRILVVGGGTAGWMAAAALAHKFAGTGMAIALVESAEIGTVGVGEATIPHIRHFNATLGIDEAEFLAATKGTYKLGIEFVDWGRKGDSYIHPFAEFGAPIDGVPFHHQWLASEAAGAFEEFSLPIQAARKGRFRRPDGDPYNYAYQFDAGLYARFLRIWSESRGVVRREGKVTDVALDGETGFVRSVTLESGEVLEADLFVDCSGFRGLLIEQALHAGYEEWTHWLPCDRAIALPCPNTGPLPPLTRATAQESGWIWRIPLQHRTGNGHVYSSGFTSDDAALETLLAQLSADPLAEPNRLRFVTGKRKRQWVGNTIAIGLASGFLEPLESTSIHLIQVAIGRLLDLFPTQAWDPLDAQEFNRLMALDYERVRDFLILHYHCQQREDSEFWRHCRAMTVPDSLAHKLELFRERGVVVQYREGTFLEPSWLAVYLGQHVTPRHTDPRAGGPRVAAAMAAMRAEILATAEAMPSHEAALGMAA